MRGGRQLANDASPPGGREDFRSGLDSGGRTAQHGQVVNRRAGSGCHSRLGSSLGLLLAGLSRHHRRDHIGVNELQAECAECAVVLGEARMGRDQVPIEVGDVGLQHGDHRVARRLVVGVVGIWASVGSRRGRTHRTAGTDRVQKCVITRHGTDIERWT